MTDYYDRALRASTKYTGWSLLCWGVAILLLAIWGYFYPAGAQPVDLLRVVPQCLTGAANDAFGNPITAPCPNPTAAATVLAVGTGTTGAVTATMAGVANKTNYLCGVTISALGGTATIGPATITGLAGGTTFTLQLTSTATGNFFRQGFWPCIPANAANTAIAVVTTADGTATAVDVNMWGFRTP